MHTYLMRSLITYILVLLMRVMNSFYGMTTYYACEMATHSKRILRIQVIERWYLLNSSIIL